MTALWIGVAGFAGAVTRYGLDRFVSARVSGSFPWGILLVNVAGSFLLGLIVALTAERIAVAPQVRLALTVGFLGAFTTFSTFAYDSMSLAEEGALGMAALNIVASVAAALVAVVAGTALGRAL